MDHACSVPRPCVVRSISVRSPFNSRLTSVFIKWSSVKRTVHGRVFLAHTVGGVYNILAGYSNALDVCVDVCVSVFICMYVCVVYVHNMQSN